MQLHLITISGKLLPELVVSGNGSLPITPLILEYTDPELRTLLDERLELERSAIASRDQVLLRLTEKFNAAVGPLSESAIRSTLITKYPEYFL